MQKEEFLLQHNITDLIGIRVFFLYREDWIHFFHSLAFGEGVFLYI